MRSIYRVPIVRYQEFSWSLSAQHGSFQDLAVLKVKKMELTSRQRLSMITKVCTEWKKSYRSVDSNNDNYQLKKHKHQSIEVNSYFRSTREVILRPRWRKFLTTLPEQLFATHKDHHTSSHWINCNSKQWWPHCLRSPSCRSRPHPTTYNKL